MELTDREFNKSDDNIVLLVAEPEGKKAGVLLHTTAVDLRALLASAMRDNEPFYEAVKDAYGHELMRRVSEGVDTKLRDMEGRDATKSKARAATFTITKKQPS